jgi:hypothetical protein
MSATETGANASPLRWIANQPYLLLSITALCWAGNAVVHDAEPATLRR